MDQPCCEHDGEAGERLGGNDGDFWASPLQTLGSGAGDCQDYAIVKYVSAFADLEFPLMISVSLSCKMKNVKRGTLPSQFATRNVG
mgnify:CR=1 FL=1